MPTAPRRQVVAAGVILVIACVVTFVKESTYPFLSANLSIPDVAEDDPFRPYIEYAYVHNIVKGNPDGTFRPLNSVNRAEVLTMLYRLRNKQPAAVGRCYSDIQPGSWYEAVVCDAAGHNKVDGYPDGTFHPEAPVLFGEFAKMIAADFDLVAKDVPPDAPWYVPGIKALTDTGYAWDLREPGVAVDRAHAVATISALAQSRGVGMPVTPAPLPNASSSFSQSSAVQASVVSSSDTTGGNSSLSTVFQSSQTSVMASSVGVSSQQTVSSAPSIVSSSVASSSIAAAPLPSSTASSAASSQASCGPNSCGPSIGMPNQQCPEGGVGGPVCERKSDGTCGYVMHYCSSASSAASSLAMCPTTVVGDLNVSMSGDGRYVVYTAFPGPNSLMRIFLLDRSTGIASVLITGNYPTISRDGRYITYVYNNYNLAVYDRVLKTSTKLYKTYSAAMNLSDDGRYIAFSGLGCLLVYDKQKGATQNLVGSSFYCTTYLETVIDGPKTPLFNYPSAVLDGDIGMSGDGEIIAWGMQNALPYHQLLFYRRSTNTVTLTTATMRYGFNPFVSGDGRFMFYVKEDVANTSKYSVYMVDIATNVESRVEMGPGLTQVDSLVIQGVSRDGQKIAVRGKATNDIDQRSVIFDRSTNTAADVASFTYSMSINGDATLAAYYAYVNKGDNAKQLGIKNLSTGGTEVMGNEHVCVAN